MLAVTRSPRTSSDREVVRWESGQDLEVPPYSRISAQVRTADGPRHLEMSLEITDATTRAARKRFRMDGRSVRAHDMVGALRVVLFSPEDVQLVTGPPSDRRRQLDILISQIDRHYMRALGRYGRIVTQRNGLLRKFAKERVDHRSTAAITEIAFWDEEMITIGSEIVAARARVLASLTGLVRQRSEFLISNRRMGLEYVPNVTLPEMPAAVMLSQDELVARIQPLFAQQLAERRAEEFHRGTTAIGPQRDDYSLTLDDRSMHAYGSRGQQRLGVIALKLSEGDLIHCEAGEHPVVLLDDVLSELDDVHREFLLDAVESEQCQVIITSATDGPLDHPSLERLPQVNIIETNEQSESINFAGPD